MAVPKYNEMMLPILQRLGQLDEGQDLTSKQVREFVCDHFGLSDDDRLDMVASGSPRYVGNAHWACTYLKQARLIESPKRGTYHITARGRSYLGRNTTTISRNDLMEFPEFAAFVTKGNKKKADPSSMSAETMPEDLLEQSFKEINAALAEELLEMVLQQPPYFFERLVVDLLLAMGYGDSRTESGFVTKKSGDGGIDGVIREDKLGFENIFIQAKRWDAKSSVGTPELQAFVGALTGRGANKGLFITTARFSSGARQYAKAQHAVKLVLVDGDELAHLMITYGVGVSVRHRYEIKGIDNDYFDSIEE